MSVQDLRTGAQDVLSVRVHAKAPDAENFGLDIGRRDIRALEPDEALVEVLASGVNPSDVKAVLGAMPHAVWPRTPGRDYAGVVRQGPADLIGREVWGSGGELGIKLDGAHASHVIVKRADLREKPSNISAQEAGAIGVPFLTAYEGLREAGGVSAGDVVLVLGGSGKVGQATVQLAAQAGARVFAAQRGTDPFDGYASGPVETIDSSSVDVADVVRERTGGRGADIVYNTVGSPYFDVGNRAMAIGARQIFISTIERSVPFDIFAFYRGRHRYVGIDTLALTSSDGARVLDALKPGFESGALKPFPISPEAVYPLQRAADAYRAVLGGSKDRVLLTPGG